jgi:hypothetical protein
MNVSHIGHTSAHAPNQDIHLKKVFYAPQAKKNLVFVHKLASDNSAYLEFHPNFLLVKDQATKSTILRGRCEKGLYQSIKQACCFTRVSLSRWHSRLGHPASVVVKHVISSYNLLVLDQPISESMCDACQQAKSHQLPYSRSSSVSKFPLELVFSDVWCPAPESVGRYNYYVSFIDNYNTFTWIYLLKYKSEVFPQDVDTLGVEALHINKVSNGNEVGSKLDYSENGPRPPAPAMFGPVFFI